MTTLNPYTITWAILTPIKGICTKKDQFKFYKGGMGWRSKPKQMFEHFPTKEKALDYVKNISLDKKYNVLFITDKQFGSIKSVYNDFKEVATSKQIEEIFSI